MCFVFSNYDIKIYINKHIVLAIQLYFLIKQNRSNNILIIFSILWSLLSIVSKVVSEDKALVQETKPIDLLPKKTSPAYYGETPDLPFLSRKIQTNVYLGNSHGRHKVVNIKQSSS